MSIESALSAARTINAEIGQYISHVIDPEVLSANSIKLSNGKIIITVTEERQLQYSKEEAAEIADRFIKQS